MKPSDSPPIPPLPWHWRLLEAAFRRVYDIRVLEDDPAALLAYNRFRYRGPDLRLDCGTIIRSGDAVLELHFRREALVPLARDGDPWRVALALLKLGQRDLPRMARALEQDSALADIRALHAITLFHRGIARFGFETMPLERRQERWFTAWQRLLMARDRPGGGRRVREQGEALVARHVWISREALIRRYGASERPGDGPAGGASLR